MPSDTRAARARVRAHRASLASQSVGQAAAAATRPLARLIWLAAPTFFAPLCPSARTKALFAKGARPKVQAAASGPGRRRARARNKLARGARCTLRAPSLPALSCRSPAELGRHEPKFGPNVRPNSAGADNYGTTRPPAGSPPVAAARKSSLRQRRRHRSSREGARGGVRKFAWAPARLGPPRGSLPSQSQTNFLFSTPSRPRPIFAREGRPFRRRRHCRSFRSLYSSLRKSAHNWPTPAGGARGRPRARRKLDDNAQHERHTPAGCPWPAPGLCVWWPCHNGPRRAAIGQADGLSQFAPPRPPAFKSSAHFRADWPASVLPASAAGGTWWRPSASAHLFYNSSFRREMASASSASLFCGPANPMLPRRDPAGCCQWRQTSKSLADVVLRVRWVAVKRRCRRPCSRRRSKRPNSARQTRLVPRSAQLKWGWRLRARRGRHLALKPCAMLGLTWDVAGGVACKSVIANRRSSSIGGGGDFFLAPPPTGKRQRRRAGLVGETKEFCWHSRGGLLAQRRPAEARARRGKSSQRRRPIKSSSSSPRLLAAQPPARPSKLANRFLSSGCSGCSVARTPLGGQVELRRRIARKKKPKVPARRRLGG